MSYYRSDSLLRSWAKANLKRYLDPREYTLIFDRLHAEKRSQQLTRVELGLLKLMLDDYRPDRSENERKRYAESNAVKLTEIADTLHCATTTVNRAKKHLNELAQESQRRGDLGRKNGLILFHDLGICVRATFWDAIRARDYSEKQGQSAVDAHSSNISLSDDKRHDVKLEQERLRQFQALSPIEQARLLLGIAS